MSCKPRFFSSLKTFSQNLAPSVWSQRKYRETNKDKKQFNFVLSKSADRVLDKLAKARGLSRSQVLELLIHEERDRGNEKERR
ncbi:ribbon-helix-helix protein, CopG family [Burkholderia thailandensis]|uniref:ribbon-helix-helix protein, CopG family n=1 Tax=Burkholderia thailandensis TaxID=57975 RepID=UPI0012E86A54|nr:ribbon-helix-helix protein, CopG family [Burkholderia thailandensis]MUV26825.1 ribbon-helix-helix protein, CopG family [Burkholderia thailandensis]